MLLSPLALPESGADAPTVLSAVYTDSTPAKNRQADVPQYGRSMIEMLGVLAIIGVLSVGGIAGYSKAMQKYRINKTIEQITLIAGNVRTFFAPQRSYDALDCANDYIDASCNNIIRKAKLVPDEMITVTATTFNMNTPFGPLMIANDLKTSSSSMSDAFILSLYGLSTEACVDIASQDWRSNTGDAIINLVVNATSVDQHLGQYIDSCTSSNNDVCAKDMPMGIDKAVAACNREDNSIDIKFY